MKSYTKAIAGFSVLGMLDSIYGMFQHYGPIGSGVCNWGARISCDIVNKSIFAEIGFVPVALIGLLGYGAIFGTALIMHKRQNNQSARILLMLAALGFLFSIYLTWVEFYLLGAICPICITSQTIITIILALAIQVYKKTLKTHA